METIDPEIESGSESEMEKKDKNIGMAVFAYFIFFFPLLTEAKDDSFVRYHVRQALVFFIAVLISLVVGKIPVIGTVISWALNIFLLALWVTGILNAIQGKEKPLPLIGKYAKNFQI